MIFNVALCAGNPGAKETFFIDTLRSHWIVRVLIKHDLDCARVRAKDSDLQIIADFMGTQHAEWIGVKPSDESAHLVTRQAGNFESFRLHL